MNLAAPSLLSALALMPRPRPWMWVKRPAVPVGGATNARFSGDGRRLGRVVQIGKGGIPPPAWWPPAGAEHGVRLGILVGGQVLGRDAGIVEGLAHLERGAEGRAVAGHLAQLVHPVAAQRARRRVPDHHVEQQVLHLQHGAVARRAVGVDAFREEVGGRPSSPAMSTGRDPWARGPRPTSPAWGSRAFQAGSLFS